MTCNRQDLVDTWRLKYGHGSLGLVSQAKVSQERIVNLVRASTPHLGASGATQKPRVRPTADLRNTLHRQLSIIELAVVTNNRRYTRFAKQRGKFNGN